MTTREDDKKAKWHAPISSHYGTMIFKIPNQTLVMTRTERYHSEWVWETGGGRGEERRGGEERGEERRVFRDPSQRFTFWYKLTVGRQ